MIESFSLCFEVFTSGPWLWSLHSSLCFLSPLCSCHMLCLSLGERKVNSENIKHWLVCSSQKKKRRKALASIDKNKYNINTFKLWPVLATFCSSSFHSSGGHHYHHNPLLPDHLQARALRAEKQKKNKRNIMKKGKCKKSTYWIKKYKANQTCHVSEYVLGKGPCVEMKAFLKRFESITITYLEEEKEVKLYS